MTTELNIRIRELEAKLEELRSRDKTSNDYESVNALQEELEHLREQKAVIDDLKK